MASFQRTVGPRADVKELQYVAALQQTCANETRVCGTISSIDIMRQLKSRYGLEISHAQARDIVRGLGGGVVSAEVTKDIVQIVEKKQNESITLDRHERWKNNVGAEEETNHDMILEELGKPKILYLDLVQMTSILLIPTIAKFAKEWRMKNYIQSELLQGQYSTEMERLQDRLQKLRKKNPSEFASVEVGLSESSFGKSKMEIESSRILEGEDRVDIALESLSPKPDGLLEFVLRCMWKSLRVTKQSTPGGVAEFDGDPPLVTPELVRDLLLMNGESERANDSALIQRMVDMAQSPSGCLDESAFVNALTSDLTTWDVGCEDNMSTTVYDVFGTDDMRSFRRVDQENKTNLTPRQSDVEQNDNPEVSTSMGNQKNTNPDIIEDEVEKTEIIRADSKEQQPTNSADPGCSSDLDEAEDVVSLPKKNTFRVIDSVLDSYGSTTALLLIWLTYICQSASYASLVLSTEPFVLECKELTFGCTLAKTIISW